MVLLVLLALGWREALIVGAAVVVTLAMTLFASWAWGFTLNRVSLFALIFSIGILVDDAIVVVENIHRHLSLGAKRLLEAIPAAVDEVGGPTILATFTVIAALLPMAFVTGLMGPYMSPIPINASHGHADLAGVAFVFTPWMSNRSCWRTRRLIGAEHGRRRRQRRLERFFRPRDVSRFLTAVSGRHAIVGCCWPHLAADRGCRSCWSGCKLVVLKMLPFDNKSEFQVVARHARRHAASSGPAGC